MKDDPYGARIKVSVWNKRRQPLYKLSLAVVTKVRPCSIQNEIWKKNLHWSCVRSFKPTEITESIGWKEETYTNHLNVSYAMFLLLPGFHFLLTANSPALTCRFRQAKRTTHREKPHTQCHAEKWRGCHQSSALEPSLRMVDSPTANLASPPVSPRNLMEPVSPVPRTWFLEPWRFQNHRNRQYPLWRETNVWTRSETARARPPLKHTAVGVKARYKKSGTGIYIIYCYILLNHARPSNIEQHQCCLALHSCAMCYQSGTPTCAVSWHCCGTAQSSTRCSVHNGARFPFQTGHAMCIVTNANLRTVPDLLENKAVIRYSMIFYIITTKPSQRVDVLRNSMIKKQFKRLICPCSMKCCRLCACFHHLPLQVLRFCCIMTFDTYFSIEKTPVTLIFNTCAPVVFQHVSNYCQAQAAKPCQNPQRCSHPQVQIVLDTPHCWKGNQCDLKWQDPNHALDLHFLPFPSFVS